MLIESSQRNPSSRLGPWNPLTDDGDALRLAVKLGMEVYVDTHPEGCHCTEAESVTHRAGRSIINHDADPYAATRRAIVRAAAAMAEGTYKPAPSSDLPEDNYYKTMGEAMDGGKG